MHLVKERTVKNELYHVIQPIVDLTQDKIIGFEFLLRSHKIPNPEKLFRLAKENDELNRLDQFSIYKILETIHYKQGKLKDYLYFINVYPSTLMNTRFLDWFDEVLSRWNMNPSSIVFEINESEVITDFDKLIEVANGLKKKGFLISVDDIGKGQANVKTVIEIEPHIAKLDLYFSKGLAKSTKKQEFIHHFSQFLGKHAKIVLEGLEYHEDLQIAKELGIPYGQGYYLGKPGRIDTYLK